MRVVHGATMAAVTDEEQAALVAAWDCSCGARTQYPAYYCADDAVQAWLAHWQVAHGSEPAFQGWVTRAKHSARPQPIDPTGL